MARLTSHADVAVVAGSGMVLDDLIQEPGPSLPFSDFPNLPRTGVAGHAGVFRFGRCAGIDLVVQSGRLHLYEGLTPEAVMATVDVLAGFGVSTIVFTNAAGGLRPELAPGDLVAADRIDLWPCRRWSDAPASIPTDFRPRADAVGPYRWVHGPSYETPAEIRALQRLGGATVGMSTAPELWRCRQRGIRAAVLSCVTNSCCRPQALTHDHVLAAARDAGPRLRDALLATILDIARSR